MDHTKEFEERIRKLREEMLPIQQELGIRSMTLEERAERWKKKQDAVGAVKIRPKPVWKIDEV